MTMQYTERNYLTGAIWPDPKPRKRIKDKTFLIWKSKQPCYVCNAIDGHPAHHIRKYGWGCAGRKPDDFKTLKLCSDHHDLIHNDPERFWGMANIEWALESVFRDIR